jgi:hypothetical protein
MTKEKFVSTTQEDFELFKKECINLVNKLGLTEWTIYYQLESLKDNLAQVEYDDNGFIATIILCNKYRESEKNIVKWAKHIVSHLLIAKLILSAKNRYVDETTIDKYDEEVAARLEKIL